MPCFDYVWTAGMYYLGFALACYADKGAHFLKKEAIKMEYSNM